MPLSPASEPSFPASEMVSRDHPVVEDMPYQRRTWTAERIGWAAIGLILLLALAGVFARGPLSAMAVASGNGNLTVEAERFHRNGAQSLLRIAALVPMDEASVSIRLGRSFLEHFNIESMTPAAAATAADRSGAQFTFQGSGGSWAVVYLRVRAEGLGPVRSRISHSGGGSVDLVQFVYP